MPIKRDIILLCTLATTVAGGGFAREAAARVTADAELGYVGYEAEANGKKVVSAHSFQQRYSLIYQNSGLFYDGRIGSYDVNLGYEWGSFNTKIKNPSDPTDSGSNANPSISAGHLLYRGEVVLDPLELPLKIKAYSYDMNRLAFTKDSTGPVSVGGTLVGPGLTTDLQDGVSINTGVTMLFGVKNGLTNGYNAIFQHIPLVMLDYRDELRKDTKSTSPIDTRLRRLAFVSLNKRDNWFHFRTTRFDDHLNPTQSFTESQFQLGTIDHLLTRRWIDMTNWLKISTDGQFTKHTTADAVRTFESYDFNLFAVAERRSWDARTFTTFTRRKDNDGLTLERTIPVYVKGVLNGDTDWKGTLYARDQKVSRPDGSESLMNDRNGSLRVDMFKRAPFTLGTFTKVEHSESNGAKILSFEGGVETASTRRFSRDYTLSASYNVKYFDAANGQADNSTYLNQNAAARLTYAPSTTMRIEAEENVSTGSGNNPRVYSNQSIVINGGLTGNTGVGSAFDHNDANVNEYLRSVTTLAGYWTPLPRLKVSTALSEDILTQPGMPSDSVTAVRGDIDYSVSDVTVRVRGNYRYRSQGGQVTDFFDGQGVVEYKPNSHLETSLYYIYSFGHDTPTTRTEVVDIRQRVSYSFFSTRGLARKLLEISEEYDYNRTQNFGMTVSTPTSTQRLTLGARYYPLRSLFVGGNARFSLLEPNSVTEQVYNASIGVTFSKLQASLDYSYGKRDGNDNRIEKRISANVKKIF
ncbi:hypothetical protein [Geobacter pickeringii]|uniref:Uncharacterized protein n=1 Tax=Geobacter pickeringii TaxID=345632 RepID=A0A0B5BBR7_9BACT|nr:hypothetical protein [Geobacter pickeringii]AJE04203.1 hypothetical protein GPICK_13315 [Geobacter pickeringii]